MGKKYDTVTITRKIISRISSRMILSLSSKTQKLSTQTGQLLNHRVKINLIN